MKWTTARNDYSLEVKQWISEQLPGNILGEVSQSLKPNVYYVWMLDEAGNETDEGYIVWWGVWQMGAWNNYIKIQRGDQNYKVYVEGTA